MMQRIRFTSLGVTSFLLLTAAGPAIAADKPFMKLSADEQKLLDLTNEARKKANLSTLLPNPILFDVARKHAANMAKQGKVSHILDGKDVFGRLDAAGYKWASAGENLATSKKRTVSDVMQGWMASQGHRETICKPKFKEIGIGIVKDANGVVYYSQVFALQEKE
jgi:uncharacterized protein YkwD